MRSLSLKLSLILLILGFAFSTQVRAVLAAPHYTLTPSTGTATVGSNLDVVLGLDTGTEKIIGGDLEMVFDAAKFDLVSVTQVSSTTAMFGYKASDTTINNSTGTASFKYFPLDSGSILSGVTYTGPLFNLTFMPKATGTGTAGFTCVPGAIAKDTNIISTTSADVVDCASNQSGSYTIGSATGGGSNNPTSAPVPTTTGTTTTKTLPNTGSVSTTVLGLVVGLISVAGAVMLKWL